MKNMAVRDKGLIILIHIEGSVKKYLNDELLTHYVIGCPSISIVKIMMFC